MDAVSLYKAGQLRPAIEALGTELRGQPTDTRRRTFLFELLCFAGEYDRAAKQLEVLAGGSKDAGSGVMLYRAALHAQRTREEMFARGELPIHTDRTAPPGALNDERFLEITDADPRIGPNLEVFLAGSYVWVPFRFIETLEIKRPEKLRDLLWARALLKTTPEFRFQDLGEVLLPVLAPLSWKHTNDEVRLGRTTVWEDDADGRSVPWGQKMLVADESDHALLEIRTLAFDRPVPEKVS